MFNQYNNFKKLIFHFSETRKLRRNSVMPPGQSLCELYIGF